MDISKRWPASPQAVSRKAEGIDPRNTRTRKDDAFKQAEVNISTTGKGEGCWHFLGAIARRPSALAPSEAHGSLARSPSN
jgi:hypothetical protein